MSAFEIELSGCIEASPEATWDILSDRDAVPKWLDDVTAVTGEGSRLLVQRSPGPAGEWIEGTIRESVPGERLALGLTDPSRLLSQAEVQLLLGPDDGGTAYRLKVACQARAPWSVLSPLLRLRAQVALHRAVRGFRAAVADRIAADRRRQRSSRETQTGGADPAGFPLAS